MQNAVTVSAGNNYAVGAGRSTDIGSHHIGPNAASRYMGDSHITGSSHNVVSAVDIHAISSTGNQFFLRSSVDGEGTVCIGQRQDIQTAIAVTGLVAAGEISYTIEDGMIISLNGTENITQVNSGSYWMIYSDLLEKDGVIYADPTYGTYNHNGGTLASCSYGAESMPVIAGYTYALVFEEMTW